MRARVAIALVLVLAAQGAGCTATVDVGDYTFEEEPCGPRPAACTGGHDLAFVVRSAYIPPESTPGHRDGIDFDGTADPICGQTDFVSPTGRSGIDNAMAPIFELYEGLTMVNTRADAERAAATGESLSLVVLTHVDDLSNDDCIDVTRRAGLLPAGVTVADLDRDADGLIDANLTFDYQTPIDRDSVACIIDHVVNARFPPSIGAFPGTSIEGTVERGRLRMPIDDMGSRAAMVAGSIHVDDLVGALPEAVVEFIRPRADMDPSSRGARDCASISFGLHIDFVPCTLGTLRTMP